MSCNRLRTDLTDLSGCCEWACKVGDQNSLDTVSTAMCNGNRLHLPAESFVGKHRTIRNCTERTDDHSGVPGPGNQISDCIQMTLPLARPDLRQIPNAYTRYRLVHWSQLGHRASVAPNLIYPGTRDLPNEFSIFANSLLADK